MHLRKKILFALLASTQQYRFAYVRACIGNQSHHNYFLWVFFSVGEPLVTSRSEAKYPVTEMFDTSTVMRWRGSNKSEQV